MASSVEQIATSLFKTIKGFGHTIVMFTDDGKKTIDPNEARRFFAKDIQMMVNLVVDETTSEVVVNLSKDTDVAEIKPMLSSLRTLANRYILEYTVKTFGKTIGPKDFSFMAKQKTNETVARSGASDYEDALGDNDTANQRAYKIGKQDAARGYERNAAKVGGGQRSKFYNAGFDGKPFRGAGKKTNESTQVKIDWDGPRTVTVVGQTSDAITVRDQNGEEMEIYSFEDDYEDIKRQIEAVADSEDWHDRQRSRSARNNVGRYFNKRVNGEMNNKDQAREKVDEGFSGWHGSARKSINELGDAKLVVRHKRTVDEEKRGARTRQIESIFIENSEGERFKFPSKNLTAAKAMCRHVKEGGTPFDDFGQYIYETMEELNQLKTFQRKNRRNDFFEDAQIGEEIGGRITQLRTNLKQISGPKGYSHHFENFTRESADVDKEKLDELKDNVTITYFDESISDSLPYVAKVIENMRGRQAREAEIMDLAKYVMDNKDNIELNQPFDEADPESPGNRNFRDPATAFAAWVNYLAPKLKDDALANKLMQASDSVFQVGSQHIKMAAAALKVIRQNAQVSEGLEETAKIDPKAMMGAIKAVKKFNNFSKKAEELENRGEEQKAGRYRDEAAKQSKQFFAIVAPDTPEDEQDLTLYGWPEATKEWVMGWFEESTYESEVSRIDETLSRLGDTRHLFGA